MADITEVVSVNVTIQDATPAVANFGTIAIFSGDGPLGAGTWQGTYDASPTGLAAMVADGFALTGTAYLKASAIVAQSPRTDKFKIYKKAVKTTVSKVITVTKTTPGFKQVLEIGVGGAFTPVSYTNGASETLTTIAAALELLIEAVAGIDSTATVAAITATPVTAGDQIFIRNATRFLTIDDPSADPGIATDLANAALEDPDFFGFVIDGMGGAEIAAAAAWADSNARIFLGVSQDTDIITAGSADVGSVIKAASRNFACVLFSRDPASAPEAGIMARQLSRDPGSSSWHMKPITGTIVDNLTATELGVARSKNVMTFVNIKGLARTLDGKAGSGRFLDITHGVEWLKARIGERVYAVQANAEKIDFTDDGIAQIEAEVRAQLADAEGRRFIAAGWTVTVPKAANVSTLDKGARLLKDVKFNATLAGAIHKVVIDGTVKV
jgi:uncharacterized protein DUF3383